MTKEEILEALKTEILNLRDHPEKFKTPEDIKERCYNQERINNACKNLNSCDASWLSEEYAKWYDIEIKPSIKDMKWKSV